MDDSAPDTDRSHISKQSGKTAASGPAEPLLSRVRSTASSVSIYAPLPLPAVPATFRSSARVVPTHFHPTPQKHFSVSSCTLNPDATVHLASLGHGSIRHTQPALDSSKWAELPPVLSFYGWWHEGHSDAWNEVKHMLFQFEVETATCSLLVDGSPMVLDATVSDRRAEVWDLHVGAVVSVMMKRFELRKADLATQLWLDQTAAALLHDKQQVENELRKFCYLRTTEESNPVKCEAPASKTRELLEVGGGRVCLRSVASSVHACLLKLRQFRNMSPTELSPLSAEILGPAWEDGSVPVMWNAKRVQSVHSQESEESTASPEPEELKTNYYEWLKTIPLAATAAGITL